MEFEQGCFGGGWGDPLPPDNVDRFECLEKNQKRAI